MPEKTSSQRKLTQRQLTTAKNIKYYWHRKQAANPGLTQADACKVLNWTHSVLGQYINGRVGAGPAAIFKLAAYFQVTPYDLDPELSDELAAGDVDKVSSHIKNLDGADLRQIATQILRMMPDKDLHAVLAIEMGRRS